MIAADNRSEKIFWCRSTLTPRKPDDGITGTKALDKRECSFTYIAGLSDEGDPETPVAMASVIPGTWKFDPKSDKKRATVLFRDGAAKVMPLDDSGHVILNGMNLFDPRQPYWGGKAPDIKWPE
ncbi:hypothetical protein OKA05_23920 [Luteolibacter arcticus]|uniref:Uncharacterized protein n=1 Tax=Luteolibacter arcticus TaxID=1581411 RepID=A0ABT3GQ60_9BACT|nr:hypothetical protein [Luteolibacter arcticus]MCW1925627.1 hypothetical protein [Luteolibacter arcticus]